MRYSIAICDDKHSELDKIGKLLGEYVSGHPNCDFRIKNFESAESLLEELKREIFAADLLFLDVYMPGKLGTDVAKELRKQGLPTKIIFITSSREHALEAFQVDAVQYFVKPVVKSDLFPILDRLLEEIHQEREKYLVLRVDGRMQRVALRDIVYCEAQGKKQCLYQKEGRTLVLHLTMAALFEMLSHYREFVKVGVAYIINLNHVESINAREICMDTSKQIHMPRGAYQSLRESYLEYYFEEEG